MRRLEGKRVYLSGPVMGRDEEETRRDFERAKHDLRCMGAGHVWSPVEHIGHDEEHESAMIVCLGELTSHVVLGGKMHRFYDALVLMPGWGDSKGCVTERLVAKSCGIDAVELSALRDGRWQEI